MLASPAYRPCQTSENTFHVEHSWSFPYQIFSIRLCPKRPTAFSLYSSWPSIKTSIEPTISIPKSINNISSRKNGSDLFSFDDIQHRRQSNNEISVSSIPDRKEETSSYSIESATTSRSSDQQQTLSHPHLFLRQMELFKGRKWIQRCTTIDQTLDSRKNRDGGMKGSTLFKHIDEPLNRRVGGVQEQRQAISQSIHAISMSLIRWILWHYGKAPVSCSWETLWNECSKSKHRQHPSSELSVNLALIVAPRWTSMRDELFQALIIDFCKWSQSFLHFFSYRFKK